MKAFELHPTLAAKPYICTLKLCKIFLENHRFYPWVIAVPQRASVSRIMDLSFDDQIQLLKELDTLQKRLWEFWKPDQINVAAIGNKTSQLHIHVIGRYQTDPAWPGTVWDHPIKETYPESELDQIVDRWRHLIQGA